MRGVSAAGIKHDRLHTMIDEQALDWVIRIRDPGFSDWEGFTQWLEADPAHGRAYDRLADWDEGLPAMVPPARALPQPANDPGEPGWKRWRIGGFATAAAAVLAVGVYMAVPRADPYTVSTGAGEQREIALADGTRIALNGDTSLRLDRKNPRFAALDRGEAVFTVRHDEANPFRVNVGDAVLQDAGTIFNVARSAGVMRVGVSEGKVIFNPEAQAIDLPAGKALRLAEANGAATTFAIAHDAVASWRHGQLVFDNAPIGDVAADIGRNLGVTVRADPAVSARTFTGTIGLDRDAPRFFAAAAPLMGLQATRQGNSWVLKEGDAASR